MKIFKFFGLIIICSLFILLKAKDYRILVLPSGGATAVIPAAILQYIEEQTGSQINKLFDEIWCSSSGAIVAALLTSSSEQKKAEDVVQFLEQNFSSFKKAYFICDSLKKIIGNSLISETQLPIRVLIGASKDINEEAFKPYDFSSDGFGSCVNNQIPVTEIVQASCTVYPYLYRSPVKIFINDKECINCIDPGSLCCNTPVIEPTAYFLKKFLNKLIKDDTLTIYFLANAFTYSIDYQEIVKVFENYKSASFAIRYHDGTFDQNSLKQIEIVNIAVNTECEEIIEKYLKQANFIDKAKIKILKFIFEKVLGSKEIVAPNLIATGAIPLSILKEESLKIIEHSKNFHMMLQILKKLRNNK